LEEGKIKELDQISSEIKLDKKLNLKDAIKTISKYADISKINKMRTTANNNLEQIENLYIAENEDNFEETDHPRDNAGKFTDGETNVNPNFKKEIQNFINKATINKNSNEELEIGKVSKKIINLANKYGVDIVGYKHTIDSKSIQHRNNRRLNNAAEDVTDEDIKQIPNVIYTPDMVDYFKRKNQDHINYSKKIGKDTYLYIEEVRNNNKTLTTKTIYKKVGAPNAKNKAEEVTSETSANTFIISNQTDSFNPEAQNSLQKSYNKIINYITNWKGNKMTLEKRLFKGLFDALIAKNAEEEDKEKDNDG